MENLEYYKQTSMFTDLGKYKENAVDLWENKCKKSLKELQHHLMSVTIHRVIIQQALIDGSAKYFEYGNLSKIDFTTPMCEDDIFLTAAAIFNEIYRRDDKGFYFERPFENKLVLTCRYISVLTSAILKANGIPCRSRAGWARYLREGKCLDHWVNEYWNEKEQRWIMFDMDDLYDPDFMKYKLYAKNKIAYQYMDFGKDQFYSAVDMWLMYRKDPSCLKSLEYGSNATKPEEVLKYLFLDFWAVMNMEYNYKFRPVAFDKKVNKMTDAELKDVDNLAKLMRNVDKNFEKLHKLYNMPKYRLTVSPLVGKDNYKLLKKVKKYQF